MSRAWHTCPSIVTLAAGYSLTFARAEDARAIAEHWSREVVDNGEDGLWFSPYDPREDARPVTESRIEQLATALDRPLTEPMWQRAWLLRSERDGHRVLGSLSLYGGRLASEMHRCSLGMGLEAAHRGKRIGSEMLRVAIEWAKRQETLAWIDLGVFEGNARARALYERAGFQLSGVRRDAFRVRGVSVTDLSMSLALGQ
jgi:RimJ/RimL family protein N-acetyltransferase